MDLLVLDNTLSTTKSKSLVKDFSYIKLFIPLCSYLIALNILYFSIVTSLITTSINYLSDLLYKFLDKIVLVKNII